MTRNPASRDELRDATHRYEDFTGLRGDTIEEIPITTSRFGAKIGKVDGILYTAVYDGKRQSFVHEFDRRDRPDFVVSDRGRQIHLLDGNYEFTERGIIDAHGDDDGIDY